ncbi:MAG: MFS transporter [Paludibacter sp.]|jgi:acyl-[acyl-carrier-protein]-phospholipid O-acyltransferase/long-chain-fatty-acid--[acyl-carrier-protein] ligase|nr:MFS transporter [Paludibacter sp.]
MNKQWGYLYLSNFSGVFNDNLLKNAVIFIAVGWSMPSWMSQSQVIAMVSAALVLPYLLLSPLGGRWAVNYSKTKVFRVLKWIELPIMLIASIAFIYQKVFVAIAAVLLMGIQSCLYSPSKYGLIRDIGGKSGSAKGSGIFEAMAFSGILAGNVVAAGLSDYYRVGVLVALFFVLALMGLISTLLLKVVELPQQPELGASMKLHPIRFFISGFRLAMHYKGVNSAVFGVSFFWMTGAILQMNIVVYASDVLQVSNTVTGIIMAVVAIGIISGNLLAGLLQSRWPKRVLVLAGSLGMTLGFGIISFFKLSVPAFGLIVMLIALAGGFFQVPWLTHIQQSDSGRRAGQLLAYMNISIFVFVLLGTLLFSTINFLTSDNSKGVFFVLLLLNMVIAGFLIVKKIPG